MIYLKKVLARLALAWCVLSLLGVASREARGQQAPPASPRPAPPAAQDEYVPLSELPPDEQLPAVPLVFIAYGLIWLAVLVYVVTIWRRQTAVEKELEALKRQLRS
jgi:CcmD family protein